MSLKTAAENVLFGYPKVSTSQPSKQDLADLFQSVRHSRATVEGLLADSALSYAPGSIQYVAAGDCLEAGGHLYRVAASAAADHHLTTVGGVKLYVEASRGMFHLSAFGHLSSSTLSLALSFGGVLVDSSLALESEVSVPDGRTIEVAAGVTLSRAGGPFFNPLGDFTLVNHGIFSGDDDQAVVLCRVAQTKAVAIKNTGWCREVILLSVDENGKSYATIDTATDLVGPVYIENPQGICTTGSSGGPLLRLSYCDTVTVQGGYCSGYRHGITAWGGDSDFAVDGADFTAERKCKNVAVIGYTTRDNDSTLNYSGGGIWGSMVDGFRVIGCDARNGADVGIDFEGCFNAIAQGNHVEDFAIANYTTFFGCRDVVFEGNYSRQRHGAAHYRTFNSSSNPDKQRNITWRGNTCRGYDAGDNPVRLASVDCTSGPVENWVEEGNVYINTISRRDLDTPPASGGTTTIRDNTYVLDEALPDSLSVNMNMIDVRDFRNRFLEITGNTFHNDTITFTAPATFFINVRYQENNRSLPVRISGNLEGFAPDGSKSGGIYVTSTTDTTPPKCFVKDNVVWGNLTFHSLGTAVITQVDVAGNFRPDGTPMAVVVP